MTFFNEFIMNKVQHILYSFNTTDTLIRHLYFYGSKVMPLENNMKTPQHFIGCPGVLNTGMFCVVLLYSSVGFFGYLKYGSITQGSITLNLPDELLAQSVKIMIAIAIFLTYSLQFYVPMEIIWKNVKHRFTSHPLIAEYTIRVSLVCISVIIAILVPNLGPFISLVGAVCLSTMGLMFPSLIELIVYWDSPGLGRYNWLLWKNLVVIAFGIVGFVTGSYTSLHEIIEEQSQ
uniref:Amino acid transporter transmembrane domain-containing protein n=1 Tax=Clastoptera arizonana TaxID=38151 RepID=A0A1B6DPC9_9HEMI